MARRLWRRAWIRIFMSETIKKVIVGGTTVVALIVFGTTLIHALWYAPDSEVAIPEASSTVPKSTSTQNNTASNDTPLRLQIPSLNIDTKVQKTGINTKGSMGVPTNFTDVAWYKYGTVPGDTGSAVIDGHVDNGLGLDGVFKHLIDIKLGDDVYVQMQSGASEHFVVNDIELYPYKNPPVDQIFNQSDTERLNLITCDGSWVQGDKTYDHRLVVYTTLVS